MSYSNELLYGLAADLATAGVGVWKPDTAYAETDRGIVVDDLPESPFEVVAVSLYADSTEPTYRRDVETVVSYVQVRIRLADPDEARSVQDTLRDRYHRCRRTLGGHIVTGRQESRAPLGPDQNNRFLYTQNFAFRGLRERSTEAPIGTPGAPDDANT